MNDLDPEPSDVTVTAFHEAGHAVVVMAGWEAETIELLSDPELRRRIEVVASGLGWRMKMDETEALADLADWEEPEKNPGEAWF